MINLFDLHCDTPTVCFERNIGFDGGSTAASAAKTGDIGRFVQICAVWIRDDLKEPYAYYRRVTEHFKSRVQLPVNDLHAPKTVLLSVEGGHVLGGDEGSVISLYDDGIRTLSLTWNGENELAGGALCGAGLKTAGRRVIGELNRLRMACDLSHLNDQSFFAAAELADFPLATHSNSRAVCPHKRNLTDDQLCILRDKNGLVGINFYPPFLGDGDVFLQVFRHVEHMLSLGLESNLAIGSDFDGADMDERLDGTDKIPDLYAYLYKMGIDRALLDRIFYQNALCFYQKLFDKQDGMV